MRRRMILHSVVTLSTMLHFADVFKRQHWQKSERYHYFSAWIRRRKRRRAMRVILTRSLSRNQKLLYSSYLSDTCHAARLFGWRPTYWAARTMCCTTLFYMLALTMMSPTTLELCVLLTCNALLAICTVHGHFQLRWTLQLIKAPRISMCTFESSCQPSITLLTCMRLRFQCSIGTLARSCSKWLYLSWTFFTPVGRFIYLVCLLMELATWLAVFLVLSLTSATRCTMNALWLKFGVERIN